MNERAVGLIALAMGFVALGQGLSLFGVWARGQDATFHPIIHALLGGAALVVLVVLLIRAANIKRDGQ